jgi:hypothetical protein
MKLISASKFTRCLVVVLMIGASSAIAQWYPNNDPFVLSGGYLVRTIYAGDVGGAVAVTFVNATPPNSAVAPNPSGCSLTYSYVILPTNTRKKEILQTFQLAFAMGRPVNVYLYGCVANGAATVPVVADELIF